MPMEYVKYIDRNEYVILYRMYAPGTIAEIPSMVAGKPVKMLADHLFAAEPSELYKPFEISTAVLQGEEYLPVQGMPGETVTINERGEIFINDQKLDETYGAEVIRNPGLALDNVYLKSDEYFVLGDNRNHSADSRDPSIGPVKADAIVGKAIFRTYPFSEWGSVK